METETSYKEGCEEYEILWEEILKKEKEKLPGNVEIKIMSQINKYEPFINGKTEFSYDKKKDISQITVKIETKHPYFVKIHTLYHELGHVRYILSLKNHKKIFNSVNESKSEFEAYKYQIGETLKLKKKGYDAPLKSTIYNIEEVIRCNSTIHKKAALKIKNIFPELFRKD